MDRRRIVVRGGVKRSKYLVPCFLFVEVSYSIHWIILLKIKVLQMP